ncbi:hypothetical protein HYH02_001727 [Chlamydomonas schloesseri]|uniref:Protein kinase domain-containing protein n=1 Tax=Chlamydomonas schloesseri TaxID=2026947 RepID=A0A835WT63_9CHLO|nr:hypothetical protein HYH02_001727 [Chlamydomonas schloesseri]|eukprot:KAG2453507.1 hypothetical protein HYH02_001727 [Chlamydomonas schloesseri]
MKAVLDLSMLPNRVRIMPGVEFTFNNITLRNIHMPLGKTAQFFSYSPGGRLVFRDTTSSRAVGLDVTAAALYSRTLPRPASDPGNQTGDIYPAGRFCFKLDASGAPVAPPGSSPYNITSAAKATAATAGTGTGLQPVTVCVQRVVFMSVDVVADVGVDNSAETVGVLYGGYTQVAHNHAYWTETDPEPACLSAKPIAVCVSERAAQLEAAAAAARAAAKSGGSDSGLSETDKIIVGVVVGVGGALVLAAIIAAVLYVRRRNADRASSSSGVASLRGDVESNDKQEDGKFATTSAATTAAGCSTSSNGNGNGGGTSGTGSCGDAFAPVVAGGKSAAAAAGSAASGGGVDGAAELLFHGLGDGQVAEWQTMRIPKSADPQATGSMATAAAVDGSGGGGGSLASAMYTTGGGMAAAAALPADGAEAAADAPQMPETIITLAVDESRLEAALVALGGKQQPDSPEVQRGLQEQEQEQPAAKEEGAAAAVAGERCEGEVGGRPSTRELPREAGEQVEELLQQQADEERNVFVDATSTSADGRDGGIGTGTSAMAQRQQQQQGASLAGDAANAAGAAAAAGDTPVGPNTQSAVLFSSTDGAMQLMTSSDADCATTGTCSTHPTAASAAAAARLRDSLATELESMKARHSTVKDVQLKVTGVLGAGAYGTVYRGEWQGLPCAVKVVVFNGNHESRKVALREAALCTSINHPNVAATYLVDLQPLVAVGDASAAASNGAAAGVAAALGSQEASRMLQQSASRLMDFRLYIIQEFCDAGPLRALIAGRGLLYPPPPPPPATGDAVDAGGQPLPGRVRLPALYELALGIARALAHLHSKSIVHSDLTPNNILLKRDPAARCGLSAKVADFGLSVIVPDSRTHLSNHRCGSPFYIAPEVYSHGQACTASDIFSFGVVLWELYMNTSAGQRDTASGRLQYNPTFPELPPTCPAGLRWLVQACLQKEVARRPTAGRVIAALAQLQSECMQQQ